MTRLAKARAIQAKLIVCLNKGTTIMMATQIVLALASAVTVLLVGDNAYAVTGDAITASTILASMMNAVTGIWGALFTVVAGICGILEYMLGGKNMTHLITFVVVGLAPHILVMIITWLFPSVSVSLSPTSGS